MNLAAKLYRTRWGKLLSLIVLLLLLPVAWFAPVDTSTTAKSMCPSMLLTETPCPGCGITRGMVLAARAHWVESALMNPFALLFFGLYLWTVIALAWDVTTGRTHHTESAFAKMMNYSQKYWWILVPATVAVWVWNVDKFIPDEALRELAPHAHP